MKKKLKISNLEVQSFMTSMEHEKEATIKGGSVQTRYVITCIPIGPGQCGTGDTAPAPGLPCY